MSTQQSAHLSNDHGEFVIFHNGRTVVVAHDHPMRDRIADALTDHLYSSAVALADTHQAVAAFFQSAEGIRIEERHGEILLDGEPLPDEVGRKALKMLQADLAPTPLIRFLQKLQTNPKPGIRRELLPFLAANDFCIDQDGLIVAWKKVVRLEGGGLTDPWTKSLDYTPPRTVTMPRDSVEADPSRACAPGLHFATWSFTRGYRAGDTVVELRVHPRDVVSVPHSHAGKGRACTIHIERRVEEWQDLGKAPVPAGGIQPASATAGKELRDPAPGYPPAHPAM